MENFEIAILFFNSALLLIVVVVCLLYRDLEIQQICTKSALELAEEDIEKLKAEIDLLKKNND